MWAVGYGPGNTFYMAVPAAATQAGGQQQQQHMPRNDVAPPTPAQLNQSAADSAASMKETAALLDMMVSAAEPGDDVKTNELIQELVQVQTPTFCRCTSRSTVTTMLCFPLCDMSFCKVCGPSCRDTREIESVQTTETCCRLM